MIEKLDGTHEIVNYKKNTNIRLYDNIEYEEYPRSGTMIRATCALGTLVLLVLNAIYAYTGVNTSFYILNGIISLILLLTVNGIYKSKQ